MKAKADRYFSIYIRQKYSDENGYVSCKSCGKVKHWKQMDCGHFIGRERMATRYSEENVAPQCVECNRFKEGNKYYLGKWIDEKWGEGTCDLLLLRSRKAVKFTKFELKMIAKHFKDKIRWFET